MTVYGFDSIDDALRFMGRATGRANRSLTPEQRSLTWGSYWVRFHAGELMIFGYVQTPDEVEAAERGCYGDTLAEEEAAELRWAMKSVHERHGRGYLFGRCYSVVEPDGELGDTHRASAWPITAETFEAARVAGWDVARMAPDARRAVHEAGGRGGHGH